MLSFLGGDTNNWRRAWSQAAMSRQIPYWNHLTDTEICI